MQRLCRVPGRKGRRKREHSIQAYAHGIRELVLHQGVTQEDLSFFLISLWSDADTNEDDDDIVTRLWSRNPSTITLVTAEELSKFSAGNDGFIRIDGSMSSSDSTLRELLDREREHKKRGGAGTDPESGGAGNAKSRFQSGLAGYEVTEEELAVLAQEIEVERKQDGLMYILDMLTAILASEKSTVLLTKLFNLWSNVVESLLREGKWTVLENVLVSSTKRMPCGLIWERNTSNSWPLSSMDSVAWNG